MEKLSEKFKVGDKAHFVKTITETDVVMFAGLTGDFNPVHIDQTYAEHSMFKKRIAHGGLVAALFSTVLGTKLPGEGTVYMHQDSKFVRPVYFGDTITAEVEVATINDEKKRIVLNTTARNQDNQIVVTGEALVMVTL